MTYGHQSNQIYDFVHSVTSFHDSLMQVPVDEAYYLKLNDQYFYGADKSTAETMKQILKRVFGWDATICPASSVDPQLRAHDGR